MISEERLDSIENQINNIMEFSLKADIDMLTESLKADPDWEVKDWWDHCVEIICRRFELQEDINFLIEYYRSGGSNG